MEPPSPSNSCNKHASVYKNGSIIVCGGHGASSTLCYSNKLGTATWEDFPPLSVHRERFSMTAVGDSIVVVGGFKAAHDVEVFNDGKWKSGPQLVEGHSLIHHCAVGYVNAF